jgi:hypothetical protein
MNRCDLLSLPKPFQSYSTIPYFSSFCSYESVTISQASSSAKPDLPVLGKTRRLPLTEGSLLVITGSQIIYQGALLIKAMAIAVQARIHASKTIPITTIAAMAAPLPRGRSVPVSLVSLIDGLLNLAKA